MYSQSAHVLLIATDRYWPCLLSPTAIHPQSNTRRSTHHVDARRPKSSTTSFVNKELIMGRADTPSRHRHTALLCNREPLRPSLHSTDHLLPACTK
jgi:hypothetical protein